MFWKIWYRIHMYIVYMIWWIRHIDKDEWRRMDVNGQKGPNGRNRTGETRRMLNRNQTNVEQESNRHWTKVGWMLDEHKTDIKWKSNKHQMHVRQTLNKHRMKVEQMLIAMANNYNANDYGDITTTSLDVNFVVNNNTMATTLNMSSTTMVDNNTTTTRLDTSSK